jgi:BASS family bile acid:Na+ symporter
MSAEQLNQLINILASVTLFEMMVAIGLGVTFAEVAGVARDRWLVAKAALASYVCVPAAAFTLLVLFQADPHVAVGFLVVAVCPGAPYGPPLTGIARGRVVVAVGLMVILAGSSALLAPLLLRVLLPFLLDWLPPVPPHLPPLTIDAGKVVTTLLIAQFLPLGIGLAVRQWKPSLADRLKKPANLLSLVLNLALLGLIISAQFDMLISVPLRGYVGMLALVAAGVAAGWLLGGPGNRSAMVMATSVRNVGVGLVIVTTAFAGTPAVAATTAFAIFQTLVMVLVALAWGRLAAAPPLAVGNAATKGAV